MRKRELNWVDFLKRRVPKGEDVLMGIGDDCALVKVAKRRLLLKSDLFIEDVHFKLRETDFRTIGIRATARVLSDFAACAGIPKFIGISVGVPAYVRENDLKEILNGVLECAKKYKFSLVGGDTSSARRLFLDIWGIGVARKYISRNNAKSGDRIFITGKLGDRKFNLPFMPRIKESQYLSRIFKINAMIDISDGFILDLYRILKESKKGALIYEENVPLTKGKSDLYRGEDYELIFTVDKKEKKIAYLKRNFYFVGEIKNADFGYKMKSVSGIYKIKPKGYVHF
jgi:thiamine-monophosphate kinase